MEFPTKRSEANFKSYINSDPKAISNRSQSDYNLEDHSKSEELHVNISENSKVYWDLSNADENLEDFANNKNALMNPKIYTDQKSLTEGPEDTPVDSKLESEVSRAVPRLKKYVEIVMQKENDPTNIRSLFGIRDLILAAWSKQNIGRDLAQKLCDLLREELVLDRLIRNLKSSDDMEEKDLSAQILSQIMTVNNRRYVANLPDGLTSIIQVTDRFKNNVKLLIPMIGVLQCLFKHSKNTCRKLISNGGLDSVLYACRYFDTRLQRHCALALANLALYGGDTERKDMINKKTPSWLFPLAFSVDDYVKYYGFLAIAILAAYPHFHSSVVRSGTLKLIEPFLRSHDPMSFAMGDCERMHGQSSEWLEHLVPLLDLQTAETSALIAFHFATEAGVGKTAKMFEEIGATERLCRMVRYGPRLAARFAKKALITIGIDVPLRITSVYLWTVEDVSMWLRQIGENENMVKKCLELKVDGDLLLTVTNEELEKDFNLISRIQRRRFIRQLNHLKEAASYEPCDETRLHCWLIRIDRVLNRYTYPMLKAGVTTTNLALLTNEILCADCSINNGLHRAMILDAILNTKKNAALSSSSNGSDAMDVFISYRRVNGSQLASLLKVHLHIRRFTVYLDIERLQVGEFDVSLLSSIKNARNFILVLTPNALDRCIGDDAKKDWIHREIVAALEADCNIIPIMDNFEFPKEDLPTDMQKIKQYNGITWSHEYQDACVNKLEQFLQKGPQYYSSSPAPSSSDRSKSSREGKRESLGAPRLESSSDISPAPSYSEDEKSPFHI